jgi:Domain of unknown function (DUF4278)
MKLHYRGSVYEYCPSQSIVPQSTQMLRYRGVFYRQAIQPSDSRLTSTEVVHSLDHNPQLDIDQGTHTMQIQPMGYSYKLYCKGWRNGSLQHLSLLQHWLLSISLDYRNGYAEGSKWR